ncbi:hypothetical protein V1264_014150 [Littorina saxatilis]|uniref:BZIP domain-containing protein n=3 Tax=Littorina saxatilis TaxID=31220 RepID=A0AAN9GKP5_9CAEN
MENMTEGGEDVRSTSSSATASPSCKNRTERTEKVIVAKSVEVVNPESDTDGDGVKLKIEGSTGSSELVTLESDEAGTDVSVPGKSDTKSKAAAQRPRIYPGFQYPPRVDYQWTPPGPTPAHFIQRRRIAHPYYPPFHPMSYSTLQRKFKTSRTMDYVPSPESFYAPEYTKSTFATSPSSLYMYDQERHDMQNTFNNGMFGETCTATDMTPLGAEPDFDLNPQYENSNSLEGFFGSALSNGMMPTPCDVQGSPNRCPEKPVVCSMLGLLGVGRQDLKMAGPTLTELNMDPFLIEDIDTIISNEDGERVQCAPVASGDYAKQPVSVVKTEPHKTLTMLSRFNPNQLRTDQSQVTLTNLLGNRTNNAVVPTATIKTEPMDTYETSPSKSCLHKMLTASQKTSATPQHAGSPPGGQVMPVAGQTRAPPLGQLVKKESMEEKWKEIEKFIHDPEPSPSRKRKRYASGSSSIMSDDEDYKSTRYSNYSDDDSDSDADSDISDTPLDETLTEMSKKSKQYFWQYNVQAKGPKGTRLKLNIHDSDPHHPANFEDPVFDENSTSLVGIRHGGKARKGDGNEVTPNPRKLVSIGKQLYKLNRQINSFQMSNDLPASVRNKSRKEKNKLASRACRLKKKAQHEANKVKLTGLDYEQGELLEVLRLIWPQLRERARQQMKGVVPDSRPTDTLTEKLESLAKAKHNTVVAGKTTDFVNDVIAKVEDGDPTGGLAIKVRDRK